MLASACILFSIFPSFALCANLDFTVSQGPSGYDPGLSGIGYFTYNATTETMPISVTSGYVTMDGSANLNYGSFTSNCWEGNLNCHSTTSNPNVSSTFTIKVSPSVVNSNHTTTPLNPVTFYGSISLTTGVVTFSTNQNGTNSNAPVTLPNYFGTGKPEEFVYEDTGGYEFGIEESTCAPNGACPSGLKTFTMYAFIAPQTAPTPEPIPAATTALAIGGLVGFALRRKFQAARA